MKIVKIGTFDNCGVPTGWHLDANFEGSAISFKGDPFKREKVNRYCLGLDQLFPGSVDVDGVEIVEWTTARREAMNGGE